MPAGGSTLRPKLPRFPIVPRIGQFHRRGMGVMRFNVFPAEQLTDDTVEQAYLSGLDRIPWPAKVRAENGQLVVERTVNESGNLHVPWDVAGAGRMVFSTGSLIERNEPYDLPLELARGKLSHLRNQLADWQSIGLMASEGVLAKTAEAIAAFTQAAVIQEDQAASATFAAQALKAAVDASFMLASCYTDQALAVRRRNNARLPGVLGADVGLSPLDEKSAVHYLQAFNAAAVPFRWREIEAIEGAREWAASDRQVEWCRANGLRVYGGPLVELQRRSLPDWMYIWEGEPEDVAHLSAVFAEAVVTRFRGKVDVWQCAGRLNTSDLLLSEDQSLQLAARIVEAVHRLDPETPVVVSFDQPWAEYLGRSRHDFPPLHFADALARAGLGLSGLMLEMNVGYYPGGSYLRDPLELSRQLDYWATLGLPLHLSVCVPSGDGDDPLATRRTKLARELWTPRTQQAWVTRYIPLMLAKPYVQGVIWNQLRDSQPHDFPHGGLFDLRRHPKPALRILASIQQSHLK